MGRVCFAALVLWPVLASSQTQEQPTVEYEVAFENAVHHEARITVTYRGIPDAPLELRMARSSPGRYALHEFAKNVYAVGAADGAGRELAPRRRDPYSWLVGGHDGTVTVSYTLYADRTDGTYSEVDESHAHLNMPATFLWARGFDDAPIVVTFRPLDDGWRVATQLEPTDDPFRFRAPNLQYFMDSPTELSDFTSREWAMEHGGQAQSMRLAIHHDGTDQEVDAFVASIRKVVAREVEVFGEPPNFDYGTYTFIADYRSGVSGDGMEHRNSTILTSSASLAESREDLLDAAAHEFMHIWNVERIRPAELEPFDFTRANPTPSLWFAEGFTQYYGPLAIRRAGESSIADYLETLGQMLDAALGSPGRALASPKEMSLRAPLVDAARSIDPTNYANMYFSYYPYGAVVALALDLTIRQRFRGSSLDDYMRAMWARHGRTAIPYSPDDLRRVLGETVRDAAFADDFFARYVDGHELPDFGTLLAEAGLVLRRAHPDEATLGVVELDESDGALRIASNTLVGSPLYRAGLDRGDQIVRVGGARVRSARDWDRALGRHRPGDEAEIRFVRRGEERTADVVFAEDPALEVVTNEAAGLGLGDAQRAFRAAWLGEEADPDRQ